MFSKPHIADVQLDRTLPDFRVLRDGEGRLQGVKFCGWELLDWLSDRALRKLAESPAVADHNRYNDWDLYVYDVSTRRVVQVWGHKNLPAQRPELPPTQVYVFGNDLPRLERMLERGEGK